MSRPAVEIVLSEKEEAELRQWIRRRTMPVGLHLRASIVIDCAEGYSGETIAQRHHTSKQTVSKWRGRFARDRLAGLSDAPRSGQPRKHDDDQVQAVLEATLNRKPKKATVWRQLSWPVGDNYDGRLGGLTFFASQLVLAVVVVGSFPPLTR